MNDLIGLVLANGEACYAMPPRVSLIAFRQYQYVGKEEGSNLEVQTDILSDRVGIRFRR